MRKLASIQLIHDILPIEGADRIALAKIQGWQCVVVKEQFKPGDYCVYFEIDAFLPTDERFEFLRASSYKNSPLLGEGFKIRTQKRLGQLSQGLAMPLSDFPELNDILTSDTAENLDEQIRHGGIDVTELLRVQKWEIEERATTGGTIVGNLPDIISKTDETRIQNVPEIIKEFGDQKYYISTKCDGSSHSIGIDEYGTVHVTGHNYEYKDDGSSSFYEWCKKQNLPQKLMEYQAKGNGASITIQGEWCGAGIQKNRLQLNQPTWYVFTVDINKARIGLHAMQQLCKDLDLETVMIEEEDSNLAAHYPDLDALLKRADESKYPAGTKAEGIVVRTVEPVWSTTLGAYLSIKAVSNKYLLKNE